MSSLMSVVLMSVMLMLVVSLVQMTSLWILSVKVINKMIVEIGRCFEYFKIVNHHKRVKCCKTKMLQGISTARQQHLIELGQMVSHNV